VVVVIKYIGPWPRSNDVATHSFLADQDYDVLCKMASDHTLSVDCDVVVVDQDRGELEGDD